MSSRQRHSSVSWIEGQSNAANKRPFACTSTSSTWQTHNARSTQPRHMASSTSNSSGTRAASSRSFGASGSEEIVSRLHESLAVFRRERDDLYRQKELASERHRLLLGERKDLERIAFIQTTKLQKLEVQLKEIGVGMDGTCLEQSQIGKLRLEVEKLNNDVQFQHVELLQKREKVDKLKATYKAEEMKRTKKLLTAKEMSRSVREQTQEKIDDFDGVRKTLKKQLLAADEEEKCIDFDAFAESRRNNLRLIDGLSQKLPRILDARISAVMQDKAKLQEEVDLAQYKKSCLGEFLEESGVSSNTLSSNVDVPDVDKALA